MTGGVYLAFDVGGTQLRAALWDEERGLLADPVSTASPSYVLRPELPWNELRAHLVAAMSSLRERVDPSARARCAGVAFPGPVDPRGRVLGAPPLWGALGEYPHALDRDLESAWPGVRVCVLNDVSAAAYRYAGAEDDTFCVVTVSTGIGNKVFARGRPLVGPSGRGGEIGHLRVDAAPDAPLCDCGGRGHLVAVASGRGLAARARERAAVEGDAFRQSFLGGATGQPARNPSSITAEDLAAAYAAGDAWATRSIDEAARALGASFAAIHMAVGVERFVLIGGVSIGLGARFAGAIEAAAVPYCWKGDASPIAVGLGSADGRCALVGAGRAAALFSREPTGTARER